MGCASRRVSHLKNSLQKLHFLFFYKNKRGENHDYIIVTF